MSFTRYGSLEGRTVIITGGASGIGACFVRAFVENGAKVSFLDLQRETGVALTDSLGECAACPLFVLCDVTDTKAPIRMTVAACVGAIGVSPF
jgi:NAD(P)-dependent dehydrogenase (short-subunit alcohol dehydrogenase family)